LRKIHQRLLEKIAEAGHELASHGFAHRRTFDMDPRSLKKDLVRSKIAIEKASGKKVFGYRAPEWSLKQSNIWALDVLKKVGLHMMQALFLNSLKR